MLNPFGQEALQEACALDPREKDFLYRFQVLSRNYPPDLARAALETAILRGKAVTKFPFADRMYFTREALEQASSWDTSTYRACRYRSFETIIDLGCSIGSDSLALAESSLTFGVDIDPLRLAIARENSRALNLSNNVSFLQADLNDGLPFSPNFAFTALFFDPSRRKDHNRVFSVCDYTPPLSIIKRWLSHFPALGVKISPAVKLNQLANYDAEIEFISLSGKLKEAVLWFGALKSTQRRATILPGLDTMESDLPESELLSKKLPLSVPRRYLYEPDPAVMRAGLVYQLGERLTAFQLDPDIAYLTADTLRSTPFARVWQVMDWFPFGLKRLRAYLRDKQVGRVTVKKRGSPLRLESFIRDLHLKGDNECFIFLTQCRGKPIVVISEMTVKDVEKNRFAHPL